ncbi:MAG: alpha/beta hydrolase [Candidatus Heimdallarchaeota archaeon]|nr:alpha/beta hydrolase [Candidatus Heimdallarchaeota archaeon]
MSLLDHKNFTQYIFYPRKIRKPSKLPIGCEILDIVIDEVTLGGLFFSVDKQAPTLLFFHGNAEIVTDYLSFYKLYTSLDVNFLVVDFRGYGFSTSSPLYSKLIADSLPTYEFVREYLISHGYNSNIFVMGRSLGSVCASEIGSHHPEGLRGIIFESGFASLSNLITQIFEIQLEEETIPLLDPISNEIRQQKIQVPSLIIHGRHDELIPVKEARFIFSLLQVEDKQLVIIDGAGHNDIMLFKEKYFGPLKSFIDRLR